MKKKTTRKKRRETDAAKDRKLGHLHNEVERLKAERARLADRVAELEAADPLKPLKEALKGCLNVLPREYTKDAPDYSTEYYGACVVFEKIYIKRLMSAIGSLPGTLYTAEKLCEQIMPIVQNMIETVIAEKFCPQHLTQVMGGDKQVLKTTDWKYMARILSECLYRSGVRKEKVISFENGGFKDVTEQSQAIDQRVQEASGWGPSSTTYQFKLADFVPTAAPGTVFQVNVSDSTSSGSFSPIEPGYYWKAINDSGIVPVNPPPTMLPQIPASKMTMNPSAMGWGDRIAKAAADEAAQPPEGAP